MNCYLPSDEYPAIVLENGSASCRVGFCGDDAPACVFPNIIGRRKTGDGSSYIGYEAQDRRELLSLRYPIEHGIVTDWEDMEKIWNFAFFGDLQASPEQHPILTTEAPLNPKGNRQKMAQVMFETYQTPAFYCVFEPLLVVLSAGRVTATIVNVGDGISYVVPIYDGYTPAVVTRQDLGGRDLTLALQRQLHKAGHSFTTSSELDVVREMKEATCFVANDKTVSSSPQSKVVGGTEQSYRLPDGTSIQLSSERHLVPEILFRPDGVVNTGKGLGQMVQESINNCSMDVRGQLYKDIVLAGGTTLMDGFGMRLQQDVAQLAPHVGQKVKVRYSPERKYHVWLGGSILASLSTFTPLWVTRQEYQEFGPEIVHRKALTG
ncbi:actin [Aplysia californica]|uniref:Actin n=1 Tax=Aplysia californica TaxID=6500 RepID=A0ABM0K1V9_APLCA|nr:actin [Aplysia californica]